MLFRKWWERDDYPQEYTPILTKDDKNLVAYLTQNNILVSILLVYVQSTDS